MKEVDIGEVYRSARTGSKYIALDLITVYGSTEDHVLFLSVDTGQSMAVPLTVVLGEIDFKGQLVPRYSLVERKDEAMRLICRGGPPIRISVDAYIELARRLRTTGATAPGQAPSGELENA